MPTVVRQSNVPEAIRSIAGMESPDYVDFFTALASAAAARSPEQWARVGLEDAAGSRGQFVWRILCGLRLEQRPDYVAGWRIGDRGDRWVRLEAASWFMTAHLVVYVDDGQLSVGTFIRYDRPIAALIWRAISVGHRRAMPGLLRQAVRIGSRSR